MDKKKIKTDINRICNVFEVYIPCVCFVVLFITYIVLIIYRYILRSSIQWMNELSWIAYLWAAVFALSYGGRTDNDVTFTIVYDRCPEKIQRFMRIVGNLIVATLFTITIPSVIESVSFMRIQKSSVMRIPYNLLYAPFILFIILADLYCLESLVKDIVETFKQRKNSLKTL